MTDEQLLKIQQEIMDSINDESKVEDEIMNTATEIAERLSRQDKIKAPFLDVPYVFKYHRIIIPAEKHNGIIIPSTAKPGLCIIAVNTLTFEQSKIAGKIYRPYTATVEFDSKYTLAENLRCALEALFRKVTGRDKAENLD